MDDEFFIGYEPMPPRLGRWIRVVVVSVIVAGVGAAALAASGFRPLLPSLFEFGTVRSFEGRLVERPHPTLEMSNPDGRGPTSALLVAPGKFGADALVDGLGGRWVRLSGTRVSHAGHEMIEVEPGSVALTTPPSTAITGAPPVEDLGPHTLRGEIVDSKCFLGVMNPGERQVHRDCAIRCLSGGIPPVFVVRRDGREWILRMTGPRGEAIGRELLDRVAVPVEVSGEVLKQGEVWWLRAPAHAYRALPR